MVGSTRAIPLQDNDELFEFYDIQGESLYNNPPDPNNPVIDHGLDEEFVWNFSKSNFNQEVLKNPGAFAGGETVATPESAVNVEQESNPMFLFDAGVSLDQLVRAVNEVGATPSDLIAILEALQRSGALEGELVII